MRNKDKDEYTDADFNMRWRFYQQTVRFWEMSKQTDERNSQSVEEARRNVQLQDDGSERLFTPTQTLNIKNNSITSGYVDSRNP